MNANIDKKIIEWNSKHSDKVWNLVGKPTIWEDFVVKRNQYYYELKAQNNWVNNEIIEAFLKEENLTYDLFSALATNYSTEVYRISSNNMERIEKAEERFAEVHRTSSDHIKKMKEAEEHYNNLKSLYNNTLEIPIKKNYKYGNHFFSFVSEIFEKSIINLKEFYKEFYLRYGKEFYQKNPEFFCYKLCEFFDFHSDEIYNFVTKINLPYYEVREYAEKYKLNEGMTKEEFKNFYHSEKFNYYKDNGKRHRIKSEDIDKYYKLLEDISLEEKIKIVEEISLNNFRLVAFAKNHTNPNTNAIIDILKEPLAALEKIKKQEKIERKNAQKLANIKRRLEEKKREREEVLFPYAKNIIINFLESDIKNVKDFLMEKNINVSSFNRYLEIIKEYDLPLYNRYMEKINHNKKQSYAIIINKAKNIIKLIKNGIELEDGTTRPFTIIDYYKRTNMSLEELFGLVKKELSADEVRAYKNFASKNDQIYLWGKKRIEQYYNDTLTFGVKFDEKNNIIPNSGHTLTLEEKKFIIDYINYLQVPLCQQTINVVQKDLLEGKIKMYPTDSIQENIEKKV